MSSLFSSMTIHSLTNGCLYLQRESALQQLFLDNNMSKEIQTISLLGPEAPGNPLVFDLKTLGCAKRKICYKTTNSYQANSYRSINQSINAKFVGRRYFSHPGAPTVVTDKHDQKLHS